MFNIMVNGLLLARGPDYMANFSPARGTEILFRLHEAKNFSPS